LEGRKVNIYVLIIKICKKIKNQPIYLIFLILEILSIIIYFPKYLYYLFKKKKIIAIDWQNGIYSSFFMPLYESLKRKSNLEVIFFFSFRGRNYINIFVLERGMPEIYKDILDNKIVICATCSKYVKLKNTVRIQIFHGLSSFGCAWQRTFIDNFDVLFLVTKFQWYQCAQGKYKELIEGKRIFKIGYPKIDKYITIEKQAKTIKKKDLILFYGPTYHREISSIFNFLSEIVQICKANDYILIIKLHPLLFYKHNYCYSGCIDWERRINSYKENYGKIILIKENDKNISISKYFKTADIFLTDCSGIGFEYVLSTGKPIIFLGNKLKIPLEDLRKGNIRKYKKYPEVYYRGKIGPIVKEHQKLEKTIKYLIKKDNYRTERVKFRKEYIFNLGVSANIAVAKIKDIYKEEI